MATTCIFLVLLCASVALSGHLDKIHNVLDSSDLTKEESARALFDVWATEHNKVYDTEAEKNTAFEAFWETSKKIKHHRAKQHTDDKSSHELGLNQFADMTAAQFQQRQTYKPTRTRNTRAAHERSVRQTPPASVNWVTAGYVTPPKDQGQCGCCWAFATAAVLEALYYKKNSQLVSYSEQNLVECVTTNMQCNGGDIGYALDFVNSNGGLGSETAYPYTAGDGKTAPGTCKAVAKMPIAPTYSDISTDTALLNWVGLNGPAPAAVATTQTFMSYTGGVMDPATSCDGTNVNHAVVVVGYGTDSATGKPYWLVKNSWGPNWGEKGYFRLLRSVTNSCGISGNALGVKA